MISKATESLIDSYIEEVKQAIPVRIAVLIAAMCALYFSAINGKFDSVTLSFLHLDPGSLLSTETGIIRIPIYVFAFSSILSILLTKLTTTAFIAYLRHISSLKSIEEKIARILTAGSTNSREILASKSETSIENFSSKVKDSQKEFQRNSNAGGFLFSLGVTSIFFTSMGNALDFFYGTTFIAIGLILLHFSALNFINKILVQKAEIRFILNSLAKAQMPTDNGPG